MRFIFSKQAAGWDAADLLVRGVLENLNDLDAALKAHDKRLDGHLRDYVKDENFGGKAGERLVLHTHGKLLAKRLALLGLGPKAAFDLERLRRAAGSAYRLAMSAKAKRLALALPWNLADGSPSDSLAALLEGLMLADYGFTRYRAPKKGEVRPEEVVIHVHEAARAPVIEAALAKATAAADGANFARDLVNTPALDMTPTHFVAEARKIAIANRLGLKAYGREELQKMGAGGILAVAQGSQHEPFLLHLSYKPSKARRKVAIVGKGVTFDSGGLSLKPAEGMMDMKIDMAGAAAVLGAIRAAAELELPVEIHAITALVENMPSGTAIRPGDIVRAMNGKTIEILNTDAEGRVTLADSLHYAAKLKPDAIIDLATLTGACMVALGQDVAGLMSPDAKLAAKLLEASKRSGEALWELPLVAEYAELVKSRHADVKNIGGGRYGGAITAGLFLKEFVPAEIPWAHLDIAGPSYNEKDYPDYRAWGASGFGVRLLLEWLSKP